MRKSADRASVSSAVLIFICLFAASSSPADAQANSSPTEQGKFRLHKYEQPVGEETYEISRDGGSLSAHVDFKFTDRSTPVQLSANFRGAADLTPEAFDIKGETSRLSSIDKAVEVLPDAIRIRSRDVSTEAPRPARFFTISGYAPATMQMLMLRYWTRHGSPKELPTPPGGTVKITPQGRDRVSIGSRRETLSRFMVEGLIWGREVLWSNASGDLVAAVTTDAEFDHFEAIRDGYEDALGTFVGLNGAAGMAALANIGKSIPGSRAPTLAISGATLIDGAGGPPVPDATVVVQSGRIVAAGPSLQVSVPKGAEVVNAGGKFLLPGLWDMHAHFNQVEWGPIYLAAGATTVRDCANEFEFITSVRDAIAAGHGLGPRILAAGLVDGSGPSALGVARVDTLEQSREWVHRYHDAGFQQMKIYGSVKLEQLRAVAEEAHRLGMTVTGHVPEGLTPFQAIEAGQDQINHVPYLIMMIPPIAVPVKFEDFSKAASNLDLSSPAAARAVQFLQSHHVVVDPTLSTSELGTATAVNPVSSFEPGVSKIAPELAQPLTDLGPPRPQPMVKFMEQLFAKEVAVVGILHRGGVPIVAGTDQAVPGHSLHREIELYVQAGFTPMEAIQAATIVPARAMRLDKELGTIEAGKLADMILLNGDPLEDIHNIRRVTYVVANGKIYECPPLWTSVGFKP
jgi:imidazolonepropionase-like amidohydrolase